MIETTEEGGGATVIGGHEVEVEVGVEVPDADHTQEVQLGDQGGLEVEAAHPKGRAEGLTAALEAGVHRMTGSMMTEHAADQRLAALNVGEMTGMIEKLHPLIEFLVVVDLLISFIKYSHSLSLHQNNPHNLQILY